MAVKELFVRNFPWDTTEEALRGFFENYGEVLKVHIAKDRETGKSRGFGFVRIETDNLPALLQSTDGMDLQGRPLGVVEARGKEEYSANKTVNYAAPARKPAMARVDSEDMEEDGDDGRS